MLSKTATTLYDELLVSLRGQLRPLPDKPEETPESVLHALWLLAQGQPRSVETARQHPLTDLDAAGTARLRELLAKRIEGVPLAHLTGRQTFMGMELLSSPDAMIPRKETELLGVATLDILRAVARQQDKVTVLDICTGSGNIALALATGEPKAVVFGSDISEKTVEMARRNAEFLGLSERVKFRTGDLLKPFEEPAFLGNVDIVACNPPYISSARVNTMAPEIISFEPRAAFDGGPFGIKVLYSICNEAPKFLKRGGWLCVEVGLGQGAGMLKLVNSKRVYTTVRTVPDAAGEIRVITAQFGS